MAEFNDAFVNQVPSRESAVPQASPLAAPQILGELLDLAIIPPDRWANIPTGTRQRLGRCRSTDVLFTLLVAHELLSEFQACWARQGRTRELRIGQYRIRDAIGNPERSHRYLAEHIYLRRPVLLRLLSLPAEQKTQTLCRYSAPLHVLTADVHPNIVPLRDVGELPMTETDTVERIYLISDFVEGEDLATYLAAHGPLATDLACDVIHQIATGLNAIRAAGLFVELRPSNVLVTAKRKIKLVELGLPPRIEPTETTTEPDSLVCTLGGLLYWCVTGEAPGCTSGRHPGIPPEIESLITRARDLRVEKPCESLNEFTNALAPLRATGVDRLSLKTRLFPVARLNPHEFSDRSPRVLIVDDDPEIRTLCRSVLEPHGIQCTEAEGGDVAIRMSRNERFDLILLDMAMPGMPGDEVCRRLRIDPPVSNLKILLFSGHMTSDELAPLLSVGADDYVTKPFSVVQLLARIKAALRLKEAQDRADEFHHDLLGSNQLLEQNLHARDLDLVDAHKALVLAMAKLVECRDTETGAHVRRLQAYCRRLAEEAAMLPAFAELIDSNFVRWLEWGAPLHDIGKAGIPDAILRKEGPLDAPERRVIQTHTVLGAETLTEVARQHGSGMAFLQMAIDIARHHHERFDGSGYPDALSHHDIPLSARLVAIADVYDALRSRRVYKPAMPHHVAVHTILEESPGQFDPALLQVFSRCAADFDKIFCDAEN